MDVTIAGTAITAAVAGTTITATVTETVQSVSVASNGPQGAPGASGVVGVVSPITNTGTIGSATIGINQSLLSITPSQVVGTAVTQNSNPTFTSTSATSIPITVVGTTSQTSDFIQFKDSSGMLQASIDANGRLYSNAGLIVQNAGVLPSDRVILAQGQDNQTGDLQTWMNDVANPVMRIVSDYPVSANSRDYGVWLYVRNSSAPTSNPTNGGYLYVENNALKYRSSSGSVIDLTSGTASYATLAGTATYATNAGAATTASTATYATLSGTSTFATSATTAGSATNAGSALTAGTSSYATLSGTAVFASSATSATTAGSATNAGTSVFATNAGTAVFATNAGTSVFATNAGTSVFASTSGTAVYATNAGTAVNISGTIAPSQVTGTAAVLGANIFVAAQILSPTAGVALTANGVTDAVTLIVKGGASNTAALQQWQTSAATVATVSSSGAFTLSPSSGTALTVNAAASSAIGLQVNTQSGGGDAARFYHTNTTLYSSFTNTAVLGIRNSGSAYGASLNVATSSDTVFGIAIRSNGSTQTSDLFQYQSGAAGNAVLGGRNALAQLWSGSTAPVTVATGGATTAASGTGSTATITTTNAHGLAVGDLVTVAGVTPTGYNSTAVVTAVTSTTFSYANTTTGSQTVAGTVSVPAQASITARSAGTVGLVVRGAASQTARLSQWQNSSGTEVAAVSTGGGFIGSFVQTIATYVQLNEENSGGFVRITKQTAAGANPGAGIGKLYFRDGTNANTLKLVVRAGAAGAETTILDNIPT